MTTQEFATGPSVEQVNRSPLGHQIADRIRRDILFARLPPGRPLRQQELCERYGTSRMPVRDALHQLEHQGFVVTTRGGRAEVAAFSREDIEDVFYAEAVLHGRAARRATERATGPDLAELESLHQQMLVTARAGEGAAMAHLNWRFHQHINRMAGSHRLLAAIRSVSVQIPRDFLAELPEQQDLSNRQHAAALEAIMARDPDRAEALLRQHIEDACQQFIGYLESGGAFSGPTVNGA